MEETQEEVDEVMSTELHLLLGLELVGCVTTLKAVMCREIKGLVSETRSSEHISILIHVQLDGLMVNFTLQPAKLYSFSTFT